jgi:ATP-dependent DNA helicase PIF1
MLKAAAFKPVAVAAAAAAPKKRARVPEAPSGPLLNVDSPLVTGLSPVQRTALLPVANGRNTFITGRAGSGKSHIQSALCAAMTEAGTKYAVTASTGIAAQAIGGVTLSSFSRVKPGDTLAMSIKSAKYVKEKLREIDVLIIDEISMVSAEQMEQVMGVLKATRLKSQKPVVILAFGDFLQLKPVSGTNLLGSAQWVSMDFATVVLTDSWRQQGDAAFLAMLDEVRTLQGELSPASTALLRSRMGAVLNTNGILPTYLTPYVKTANDINLKHLSALPGAEVLLPGSINMGVRNAATGMWSTAKGAVPVAAADLPPVLKGMRVAATPVADQRRDFMWQAENMVATSNMESMLRLKINAQVMFTANLPALGVVNGTRGVVISAAADRVVVKLLSGEEVVVEQLPVRRPFNDPFAVVFLQYPLKLAWAITIHKSQGMSLDYASISIGRMFERGQAYVALSRVRSLAGMTITEFDPSTIQADADIVTYYKTVLS